MVASSGSFRRTPILTSCSSRTFSTTRCSLRRFPDHLSALVSVRSGDDGHLPAAWFSNRLFHGDADTGTAQLWVLLITIPFWSNLLVRTLAIMFIIRDEGLINNLLMGLGVIEKPITMLYTNFAIQLGLLYSFLPFMILPLYASLEKLDFRLVEPPTTSMRHRRQALWRVIIPLSLPASSRAVCWSLFPPSAPM